jgi:type I restriction enzyme M protein
VNLDIFWLKDKNLGESEDLSAPDLLAQEIADDLQTARVFHRRRFDALID